MRIEVRQEDIEKGKPKNAWACPISLALFRETNWKWIVQGRHCSIVADLHPNYVQLPPSAQSFIDRFDATSSGETFAFDLPCEAILGRAELWLKLRGMRK